MLVLYKLSTIHVQLFT